MSMWLRQLAGAGVWVLSASVCLVADAEVVDLDFCSGPGTETWSTLNDTIMGGQSTARFELIDGAKRFSGQLSQDNRGGFASIQDERRLRDLSGTEGFELTVRGDGRTYSMMIWTDNTADRVYYSATFTTIEDEWQTIVLEWADFRPYFRGFWVAQAGIDPSRIVSFGLMISDGQEGPFVLDVKTIRSILPGDPE